MVTEKSWIQRFAIFIGRVLLIDLGLFVLASGSCLIGVRCTSTQWSERMFWLSLLAMLAAAPVVLAALNTGRGYFNNPFTAGPDSAIATDIINRERRELISRTTYMFTMLLSGIIGIGISALIDLLTR